MESDKKRWALPSLSPGIIVTLAIIAILVISVLLFEKNILVCLNFINLGNSECSAAHANCWFKNLLGFITGGLALFLFTGFLEIALAIGAIISLAVAAVVYLIIPC